MGYRGLTNITKIFTYVLVLQDLETNFPCAQEGRGEGGRVGCRQTLVHFDIHTLATLQFRFREISGRRLERVCAGLVFAIAKVIDAERLGY